MQEVKEQFIKDQADLGIVYIEQEINISIEAEPVASLVDIFESVTPTVEDVFISYSHTISCYK